MALFERKLFLRPRVVPAFTGDRPVSWRNQREALSAIDTIAASGAFDRELLDRLRNSHLESGLGDCKPLIYYTASLYLQMGLRYSATELLRASGSASAEMKWFAAVMIHSMTYSLPMPRLNRRERLCLSYLQQHLVTEQSLFGLLKECSTIAVLGNAPGVAFSETGTDVCSVSFNGYRRNPRIDIEPLIHVVTPSWKVLEPAPGQHLCITGNNIFHRRSKVWRRFLDRPGYSGIHILPRQLWVDLNTQLKAPPSAGALILCYLARYPALQPKRVLIGGFSIGEHGANHSYDRQPRSDRHNWSDEVDLRRGWLDVIKATGVELVLLD